MNKDAYYFSHDFNARNDEKITELRYVMGWEGYGIFWAIVEMLWEATANTMQLDCKRIAFALHCEEHKVRSVICDFKLFTIEGEKFSSESVKRRKEKRDFVSQQRRKAAQKRWDNANAPANAKQAECKSNALKERKGNRKGKRKESSTSDDAVRVAEFLLNQIRSHNENFKKPNIDSWAKDIDKAIRIDGRTPRELCEVAKWAHVTDEEKFWRPNILSGKKLRDKFDQLSIKMNASGGKAPEYRRPVEV